MKWKYRFARTNTTGVSVALSVSQPFIQSTESPKKKNQQQPRNNNNNSTNKMLLLHLQHTEYTHTRTHAMFDTLEHSIIWIEMLLMKMETLVFSFSFPFFQYRFALLCSRFHWATTANDTMLGVSASVLMPTSADWRLYSTKSILIGNWFKIDLSFVRLCASAAAAAHRYSLLNWNRPHHNRKTNTLCSATKNQNMHSTPKISNKPIYIYIYSVWFCSRHGLPILDVKFWCPVTTMRTTTTTTTDDDDDDANHLRNENWQFLCTASQPRCPIERCITVHTCTNTQTMHREEGKTIAADSMP